ncbi:hypothetical protein Pelo_10390 [Pelomyxa schiedti]|nr:hypothetical protein Pelo_10390 [Pelomyxa schiedti]
MVGAAGSDAYSSLVAVSSSPHVYDASSVGSSGVSGSEGEEGKYYLVYPVVGVAMASLLGSLFVIAWIITSRRMKTFHWRLVFMSSLCQSLVSLTLVLEYPFFEFTDEESTWCSLQGFFQSAFQLAGEMWIMGISFRLHRLARKKQPLGPACEIMFHLLIWPVCALLAAIPFYSSSDPLVYVPLACGYCWLTPDAAIARILIFYVPQWFVIFTTIGLYIHVTYILREPIRLYTMRTLRLTRRSSSSRFLLAEAPVLTTTPPEKRQALKRAIRAVRQLVLYPMCMLLTWVPCTVCRVIQAVNGGVEDKVTSTVLAWMNDTTGLFFFFACLLTGEVFQDLKKLCRRMCCCRRDSDQLTAN